MSRRLHRCRTCTPDDGTRFLRRGWTRHDDQICSSCRRHGAPDPLPDRLKGRAA